MKEKKIKSSAIPFILLLKIFFFGLFAFLNDKVHVCS